jgi:selenophosphate synthetase-related protein
MDLTARFLDAMAPCGPRCINASRRGSGLNAVWLIEREGRKAILKTYHRRRPPAQGAHGLECRRAGLGRAWVVELPGKGSEQPGLVGGLVGPPAARLGRSIRGEQDQGVAPGARLHDRREPVPGGAAGGAQQGHRAALGPRQAQGEEGGAALVEDGGEGQASGLGVGQQALVEEAVGERPACGAAVCEAARNVACSGARPKAITNNLNFGNPKKPEVYFQLSEAIAGMGEACTVLETPVTGGNVSLYNENPQGAIHPTPTIGMVGLIESLAHITPSAFQRVGDAIVLLGECTDELGASEYLLRVHGLTIGEPPACNPATERSLIDALLEAIAAGVVRSAHDCSDGGLAVALAEMALAGGIGAEADLAGNPDYTPAQWWFGEDQGRYLVTVPDVAALNAALAKGTRDAETAQIGFQRIGTVGGDAVLGVALSDLRAANHRFFDEWMEG